MQMKTEFKQILSAKAKLSPLEESMPTVSQLEATLEASGPHRERGGPLHVPWFLHVATLH